MPTRVSMFAVLVLINSPTARIYFLPMPKRTKDAKMGMRWWKNSYHVSDISPIILLSERTCQPIIKNEKRIIGTTNLISNVICSSLPWLCIWEVVFSSECLCSELSHSPREYAKGVIAELRSCIGKILSEKTTVAFSEARPTEQDSTPGILEIFFWIRETQLAQCMPFIL